jgi:hypothetical protein
MTATASVRADPARARAIALVLAHTHLRLGALALARVELETMATLGILDGAGLVDLAEVRWRTGDLTGAGEASAAALGAEVDDPVALTIAAEAAASLGRPSEARRLAQRAMTTTRGSIDAIFAGMPRSGVWPPDADEPPPTAPTLFDRAPDIELPSIDVGSPDVKPATPAAAPAAPKGPVMLGFWDDDEAVDPGPTELPDPAAELEAGRAALVAGSLDDAGLHLGLALRLAPALAPAVLEATAGARGPSVAMVRGDAYRLAGHEAEARNAYADAARGGPPERRKRSRTKVSKPTEAALEAGEDEAAETEGGEAVDGATEAATMTALTIDATADEQADDADAGNARGAANPPDAGLTPDVAIDPVDPDGDPIA